MGTFQSLEEGEILELEGDFTEHAVYGSQFKVSSFKFSSPEDAAGMERYLGSGAIKGVGASLAARIVKRFGADTFRIVEEEPERLAEIKGISERKAMDIASQMEEKHEMREAMVYLQKYGISNTLAVRIYETYGSRLYRVLEENPYQLADDIDGIGFRKADELAARIGIHTDSDFRIRSGILYTLLQASGEGHMYLPGSVLIRRAAALLDLPDPDADGEGTDDALQQRTADAGRNQRGVRVSEQKLFLSSIQEVHRDDAGGISGDGEGKVIPARKEGQSS